jgi:hypothetical protein
MVHFFAHAKRDIFLGGDVAGHHGSGGDDAGGEVAVALGAHEAFFWGDEADSLLGHSDGFFFFAL